jgi:SMC interacting uncharacterized protein involved in chromosome segregation
MIKDDKIKYLNDQFDSFLKDVSNVRRNVELEEEFSKGYLKCVSDILESIANKQGEEDQTSSADDEPEPTTNVQNISLAIERIVDMRARKRVIDELSGGLSNLLSAYKSMQSLDGE